MNYLTEMDFNNLPPDYHILGEAFVFVPTKIEEYYVDFDVYERISFCTTSADGTILPDSVEIYLKGSIKWDGCSHINLLNGAGELDEYKHICGRGAWQNMIEMYELTYKHAMSLMNRADKTEVWEN